MLGRLAEGELALGPVRLALERVSVRPQGDGVLLARWPGHPLERRFVFDCKAEWTRRTVERALDAFRKAPRPHPPLLIFPYLSGEALEDFQALGVSAIDLCGNGLLIDPPHLFILRTGASRSFKASTRDYSVYLGRNVASLVSRIFLIQDQFPTAKAVLEACRARLSRLEGQAELLAPSTVSKALAQLERDLIIDRKGKQCILRDPARLLDELARSFRFPSAAEPFLGKTPLPAAEVWSRLEALRPRVRAVATGRASASRYTGLAGPERLQLYVSDARVVRDALEARPTRAFPNLELLETAEETAYFDTRLEDGVPWSSPVQAYVELAHGTARELDAAQTLRSQILRVHATRPT